MEFIEKHENVIFLGPPGVGKTHLAISLAIKACAHGFKVYFITMDTLIKKLKESQSNHKAYLTSPLVVVDEVGYLPIDSREAYLFFQFVSHLYERSSTFHPIDMRTVQRYVGASMRGGSSGKPP